MDEQKPLYQMTEAEAITWALTYARIYWQFGIEPESQAALAILAQATCTIE